MFVFCIMWGEYEQFQSFPFFVKDGLVCCISLIKAECCCTNYDSLMSRSSICFKVAILSIFFPPLWDPDSSDWKGRALLCDCRSLLHFSSVWQQDTITHQFSLSFRNFIRRYVHVPFQVYHQLWRKWLLLRVSQYWIWLGCSLTRTNTLVGMQSVLLFLTHSGRQKVAQAHVCVTN